MLNYSGKEMLQSPSNVTKAELGYKPVAPARIALEVVNQRDYWMNNANTVSYGGHTLLNARGSYKLSRGRKAWLQGRNLTDEQYADLASSPFSGIGVYSANTQNQDRAGASRSFMVGLTWTFDGRAK